MVRDSLLPEPLKALRRKPGGSEDPTTATWSDSGSAAPTDVQVTARVVFHCHIAPSVYLTPLRG